MSNATFPAGAGAPPVNAPGHDGSGAPVCSEAEGFSLPVWAEYARRAGIMLAHKDGPMWGPEIATLHYRKWHDLAVREYADSLRRKVT